MRQKTQFDKRKIIIIGIIAIVIGLIAMLMMGLKAKKLEGEDLELAKAMTYDQFEEGDEIVDGTNNCVEFSAFFLRDLNGDGYAEKLKGTCKEVGKEDTLYLEVNVLTEGELKDATIKIDSDNFYFNTAIVKDEQVKNNYIGVDTKQIELNTMKNGTQKLLSGNVRSGDYSSKIKILDALKKDISKYSGAGKVVLTGTYVAKDGTETRIEKEIDLAVDWYGETKCSIPEQYKNGINNKIQQLPCKLDGIGNLILDFTVATQETENELLLSKSYIEGTIPDINGYKPLDVKIEGTNVEYTYDKETCKYTAQRKATLDETGKIESNAYSAIWRGNTYNEYRFLVTYPKEAYESMLEKQQLKMPITAYYEGYNNTNEEFNTPYKSNIAKDNITIIFLNGNNEEKDFKIQIGDYKLQPKFRYVVSKEKPTNIYNHISEQEEKDYYIEEWSALNLGEECQPGIIMKDTRNLLPDENEMQITNEFVKADETTTEEMGDIVKYAGIYLTTNLKDFVESNGWIRVYDDETDELLIEFTEHNYGTYNEENPYYYETGVSHVRIETSALNKGGESYTSAVNIQHIKEIDDEKITTKYTKEQFEEIKYIKGKIVAYIKNEAGEAQYVKTNTHQAVYENKLSIATVGIQPQAITTQTTSAAQIVVKTVDDEMNHETGWKNGTFLLKLPKEIIDLQIETVRINDTNTKIDNYEVYEKDGNFYIKIYTSNEKPSGYDITIDCDITTDPIISTTSTKLELYATNEQISEYYHTERDQYDINNNGRTNELINYETCKLDLISPSSLLTSSVATEYDKEGTVTIAPRTAKVDKDQRQAKVSVNITNNYGGTISDIIITGKVPFEGNGYTINGNDLHSQFTTTMQNSGIEISEEIQDYAKVYYSTNEKPTIDIEDKNNGWIAKEEVENWDDIKSYIVILENYVMPQDNSYLLSYKINIPEGLDYNEITYCTHAVYFSLDTEEGKYRTKVESNKLGFVIAKQYDLELKKYQIKADKVVKGATYSVTDTQNQESRTAVTDENGNLLITGLYAEKEYRIKEIKTPQEYALNEDEITINTTVNEQGHLQVNLVKGNVKNINVTKEEEKDWKVNLEVEDEPKARLKIVKTNKDTGEKLAGAQFKIAGKGKNAGVILATDGQGEINSKGLYLGEEYTIEETKLNGYFLMEQPVKFVITRQEAEYKFELTNGEVYRSKLVIEDGIPVLTLEIQNSPRPTYQLEIQKVEKNTTEAIAGAKFKLEGAGIDKAQYDTTDGEGHIVANGLYIGVDETEKVEYTLTETEAPQGYIKISPITFKAYNQGDELKVEIITGEIRETKVEGNKVILVIEDDPVFKLKKKDGEDGTLLPNVKFALYKIGTDGEESFATDTKGETIGKQETIDGEIYYVLQTNEKGEITADLAGGLYKVVELETLEKYKLPEEIEERSYYFGVGDAKAGGIEFNNEWATTLEANGVTAFRNVIQTSDGGYLSNGVFYSPTLKLPSGKLTNHGDANCFILKYDADRNIVWGDSIGGSGSDKNYTKIVETTDGGYMLAGDTNGNDVTLSNGDVLTSQGNSDMVIVKYDAEGNIMWSDLIGSNSWDSLYAITETADGGVILGGEIGGQTIRSIKTGKEITKENGEKGIVLKYDKNGDIVWHQLTPFDIHGIVEARNDDEYIVEGSFYKELTLPNGETIDNQSYDTIVAKYDTQGNIIWHNVISGSDIEQPIYNIANGMIKIEEGGYLAVGQFESNSLVLSNGDKLIGANPSVQTFIIKYTEDGRIEWSNQVSGNSTYGVKGTKDGGIALISKEAGFVKFDRNGKQQWSKKDLGMLPYNLEETEDGKYVIGGSFKGNLTLPNGDVLTNDGTESGIFVKYDVTKYPEVENLISANKKLSQIEYKADYAEYIGGTGYDHSIKAIANTMDGGYLVSEPVMSKNIPLSDGTTLQNKGSRWNNVLVRYDRQGNIIWSTILGGTAGEDYILGMAGTKDNGFIAVGQYQSSDFVLEDGTSITNTGSYDGIVIKYDAEGNIQWSDTIGGNGEQRLGGIIQTQDEGYVAVGYINGTTKLSNGQTLSSKGADVLIIKYDKDGNIEYYKIVGDSGNDKISQFHSVVDYTADDGFVIGMFCAGSVKFDDTYIDSGNSTSYEQGIIIKCNSRGELEWHDNISGKSGIYSVSQTSDGGYVASGYYANNIALSNGDIVVNESGSNNGIIIKYDDKGNIQWHRETTGEKASCFNGVKGLSNGNIGVVGKYEGTITLDKDKTMTSGYNDVTPDGMILVYDENGNLKWNYSSAIASDDTIEQIEEASEGGIIVGGCTYGTITNNEDVVSQEVRKNDRKGGQDGYIIKLSEKEISPEKQGDLELQVENERKEYAIKTKVEPINKVKGGAISGETEFIYEVVKHGDSNTKEIVMTPQENYEIIKITVNGEEQEFTANADGTYTLPAFSNMTEDKEVVVTYALSANKITIEKVDAQDNNIKLKGAKIKLERIPDADDATQYQIEVETNNEGQAITQIPYGTYKITELEAPKNYQINTAIENIVFSESGNHTFTIEDNQKPSVVVHHKLKDRSGNYTETKVAEDEVYYGDKGEGYRTEPKLSLDEYDLEKDEAEQYVIPANAIGTYQDNQIIVNYYYEERQIPLTVHYYIEGTENKVPLDDNTLAEDVVMKGYKGTSYTTQEIANVNEKYELVEIPDNSNGTYGDEEIVVNYYYKLRTSKITTKVVEHEETNSFGQIEKVKGGTISGEGHNPYETVVYGENSIKELIITPDEGYQVKTIKINGKETTFTPNEDKTVELTKFVNLKEDKEIEVEFQRIKGTVTVHHYINGTTTKVPSKTTGVVEDEVKTGVLGSIYATKVSADVSDAYEYASVSGETSGTYTEDDIVVIYYYQLTIPTIENNIEKTATANKQDETGMAVLTKEDGTVTYNITYDVNINDYMGKAMTQIVDTLPGKIVREKSDLAGGTYNQANHTITWEEEIEDINTFVNGNYTKKITKQITVVYEEQNVLNDLVNTVNGKIKTYYPENHLDKEGEVFVEEEAEGTETLKQEYQVNLKVMKVWDDNENLKGKRPDSVTIKITPSNGAVMTAQLNQANNWTYEKKGLPKYEEETGKKITYTVTESETNKGDLEYYEEAVITPQETQTDEVTNYQYTVTNRYEEILVPLTVHYYIEGTQNKVPLDNNELAQDVVMQGERGETYTTQALTNVNEKYALVEVPSNSSGTYVAGQEMVVIYYYKLRETNITVSKELSTQNNRKYVLPGEKITYKVVVKNEGDLGKDVIVKDTIPEGTTFVEGSIKIDEQAQTAMTVTDLANGITIHIPMANKEEASVKTLSFEVAVKEDATGIITNTASVDEETTNEVTIPIVSYEATIDKTSKQDKVTTKDTNVYYEIEFNATVNHFEGKAVVTMIDTLPYPINQEKSDLNGGNYDANSQTITWQQEIDNMDTFSKVGPNNIKIIKAISLNYAYQDLDHTTGSMKNKVKGTIALQAPKADNPKEYETIGEDTVQAEEEVTIEIPAQVRVHHYIYDAETGKNTTTKLVGDEIKQGIIGEEYTTSKSNKIPANYTCVNENPENATGKMKELPIDVNYYYQLTTPTIQNSAQKTVTANKKDENGVAILTKEDGTVTYNLTYDINVKDYIGKATVKIVDTLPAKIDQNKSNLAGGTYHEATQTITWEEEIDDIDTFAKGNYTKTITKQITVVYKGQNVLSDLVNNVTGEIKTYYPEKHLNKGGKEFVKEKATETATLKQQYQTDIKVVKVWDDNQNLKAKRPNSVTIKITPSNGTAMETQLKQENNWTYEKFGLPKYDEKTGRKITYTVTESETKKGDLEYYEPAVITTAETQTDKTAKYNVTVTNRYKLVNTNLNTQVSKTGTKEITSKNDEVVYTLNLKSEIKNYIGEGRVVIVDTLPYKIDVEKSDLAKGVYDAEKQTITFEEELPHINTQNVGESYKIDITKQIKLVYKDINLTADKLTNRVNGKVELYETNQKDEKTATFDTNINVKGKVIAKYVDKMTQKEIANREEFVGKIGEKYNTKKKEIKDYQYVESTNNVVGKIQENEQEVIYYYEPAKVPEKTDAFVIVKYQDKNGKMIADNVVIKGHLKDVYQTEKKDISNYRLVEIKGEARGVMTKTPMEVIYVYEKIPAKIIVKYVQKQTQGMKEVELLPSETIEGFMGDHYEVARKVIPNYRAAEPETTNANGTMTEQPIEIIYYYEKIPSGMVTVKYVDMETEQEIINPENKETYGYQITGFVGDEYETKNINIPYYTLVKTTDNKKGKLTEVGDSVICYYRKLDFNIAVDKTISEITLNGKNVSVIDNQLAKVEVKAKEVDNTNLMIKYNIKVTNKGELAGKATVLERLPSECELVGIQEYWNTRNDGMLESEVELEPGESRDLSVTLKWNNGQSTLGSKANIAQIINTENGANYEDSNDKDDSSEATVIISIKTGEWVDIAMNVVLITALVICLTIMASLTYNIKKAPDVKKN